MTDKTYTVPLRKQWLKAPKYKRAKKAVIALKQFIQRHTKQQEVLLGKQLNHALWARGIKCPPGKIRVNVRTEENVARVELFGIPFEEVKKEEAKKSLTEKLGLTGTEEEKKVEEKKPETEQKKPEIQKQERAVEPKVKPKTETKPEEKNVADKKPEVKELLKPVVEKKAAETNPHQEKKEPKASEKIEKAEKAEKVKRPEKTVEQSTQEMFESAKKLNDLAQKAKKKEK